MVPDDEYVQKAIACANPACGRAATRNIGGTWVCGECIDWADRQGCTCGASVRSLSLSDVERKMLAVTLMPAGEDRDRLESTIGFSSNDEQETAYAILLDRLLRWPASETPGTSCCGHKSDCAVHNGPALPTGPCTCGASPAPGQESRSAREDAVLEALAALVRKQGLVTITAADFKAVQDGDLLWIQDMGDGGVQLHVGPNRDTFPVPIHWRENARHSIVGSEGCSERTLADIWGRTLAERLKVQSRSRP